MDVQLLTMLAGRVQQGRDVVNIGGDGRATSGSGRPVVPADPPAGALPGPGVSAGERYEELVKQFAAVAGVTLPEVGGGRGFGSSALKVTGSIFAMLVGGQLAVKLPRKSVDELIEAGVGAPFRAGKASPMTEWLTVTDEQFSTRFELAQEALHLVRAG